MIRHITLLDLVILVSYVISIICLGIWTSRHSDRSAQEFFLAGRGLSWGIVGAALFASNISTIHLVGLAASGYNEGLVWGNFEWMASFTLILLSLVFAPFYFRSRIATLPEFLERRYSPASRMILAFMGILAALFIHIGMSLYAGAVVFQQFFGIPVTYSILFIAAVISIYTIVGGLRAVVMTETMNTVVLLFGVTLISIFAIRALPASGIHTVAELRAAVKPGQLTVIQTNSSVGLNWYAVLLGYPVLGVWYWCTDQTIVQRVLGAKSERDAQLGPLFAGFLKILPMFLLILPGVLGYVLFRKEVGINSNQTLPVLIQRLVPTGLRGLISAAVLAALMSAVSAALNSSGTLIAVDIVKRFRPALRDEQTIFVGRISSAIIMVLAVMWSTQGGRFSSIFEAINIIAADLAPPITVVFLFGVLWKRGTKQASISTLILGLSMGTLAFLFDVPLIGTVRLITVTWGISFLMQAWWMFVICSVCFVVVSFSTPAPLAKNIDGLCWEHPIQSLLLTPIRGVADPRIVASSLFAVMCILYVLLR